ncbi:hypothetical protein COOONC_21897 [Cooperia oncophora]
MQQARWPLISLIPMTSSAPLRISRKYAFVPVSTRQRRRNGDNDHECRARVRCSPTIPIRSLKDYIVSHEIIGIGESGKVMACYNKYTNEKYALKVLRDGPKARREVSLHYLTKHGLRCFHRRLIVGKEFKFGIRHALVFYEFVEAVAWLESAHENVVTIIDIYENTFDGVKCLLMVVEFLEGGDLLKSV